MNEGSLRACRLAGWLAAPLVGAALQLQQPQLWSWQVYGALLTAAGAAVGVSRVRRIKAMRRTAAALSVLAVAVASFALVGCRAASMAADAIAPVLEGRDVVVQGAIDAMPQRSEAGQRFVLVAHTATLDGAPVRVPPRLLLGWWKPAGDGSLQDPQPDDARLVAGEVWRMTVRLKAPHGNVNPHGFDFELWLWGQRIGATGYVRAGPRSAAPVLVRPAQGHYAERLRQATRDAIFARVTDPAQAGVLAALAVGDQQAIERAQWDVFRATGVAHLMSISGLHVTMFAWFAAAAVGWLWRRSARLCLVWPAAHAALVGGVACATAYAVISGWGVPSQRTVWMLAVLAALRLGGLRWPWPMAWLLTAAAVVTLDPYALLQAGFWLSFVAVGVLFASGGRDLSPNTSTGRLRSLLREQGVVTVALAPLTLLLFGQASVVGLLANLVAIPWVTLVITPLALGGAVIAPLWTLGGWAVQALGWLLSFMSAWPGAVFSAPAAPTLIALAGVAGGVLLVLRLPLSLRLAGLPLVAPMLLWQAPRPPQGEFEVLAADVGQGNAVIVRTAGHALVYDAGPRYGLDSDAGHRVLAPLLAATGERLDKVVISHRDSDHSGGAAAVLAQQPQAQLVSSIEDGHALWQGRRPARCLAGQRWRWDGVDFEFLHPLAADYARAAVKPNALSCVLRISQGAVTALLAGDIEAPQEQRLVLAARTAASQRGLAAEPVRTAADGRAPTDAPLTPDLRADLLLAPHHGSKTSSTAPFLAAVQPRIVLVQAGYRNRFGHPAAPVLARYQVAQAQVLNTVDCGAATWRSTDPGTATCERQTSHRYWRHKP